MAGDTCQMAIHKKPMGGGLSAVGGNSEYTYFRPNDKKYKGLVDRLYADIPTLLDDWPAGPYARDCPDEKTEYTVGEFNCSCVGISKFQAVCGGEKTLADVPDADYYDACELTDLMGVKAIEMLHTAHTTVDMKVSTKKGVGFYIRAATSFLKGVDAKPADGDKPALEAKPPKDYLTISGLGEAAQGLPDDL